jgi:DNA-binding Xre family transcriptional regulator
MGKRMSQTKHIITALKKALKANGKTYSDVAKWLTLSEASVKRLFAEGNLTLERLETICGAMNMEILELIQASEQNKQQITQLTLEQEQELVSDTALLLMAHSLMNKWTFQEIIDTYQISETEGIQLLARLDRMKVIELLPGNRVKLLISREFTWLRNGPIQCYFEQQLQVEFFNSRFDGKGEYRHFVSGMLSESSLYEMQRKLKKLTLSFNDCNSLDETLPLSQRYGVSLFVAMRPWETEAFSKYRRHENKKAL